MTQGISEVLGEGGTPATDPFAGSLPAPDASYKPFSFTAARFVLAALASRAGSVVPARDFQPVLKNFLVTVSGTQLRLVATDLELTVIATSPAVSAKLPAGQETATAVLPARRLQAILQAAPDTEVTIAVSGDSATVTAGTASWVLRLSSDSTDYPDVLSFEETPHQILRKPFLDALQAVRYAVSKGGTKPQFMQVNASSAPNGDLVLTASDSTRFARAAAGSVVVAMRIPATGSPSAVDELVRLLGASQSESFEIQASTQKIKFQIDSTTLIVSMIGKEYPDVDKLILGPALENDQVLTVDRRELLAAITRSRINADETTSALGLRLASGELTVYSRDTYQNTAEQIIPAGWEGAERTLIVNHKFLSEMLSAHPGASCTFRLGKDVGRRKSKLLLTDADSGVTGIISQMAAAVLVGYDS